MRRYPLVIFVVALVVRIGLLASPMVPREWVLAGAHVEVEKVARSLVSAGRYADPYIIPTGPTAHPLPIHTGLLAIIYLALGVTPAAAYARSLAGIVACASAFAVLPWLSRRLGLGTSTGVAAGLFAAVVPLQGTDDILGWLWNEAMAALALAALMVAFVSRWQSAGRLSAARSAALGAGAGVAFHLAPPLLPVVAGYVAFEAWWIRGRRKWAWLLAMVCGALLACVPWGWRLYRTFDEAIFIRSNFGLELRIGNHDGAQADIWATAAGPRRLHPGNNPEEALLVRQQGEAAYMSRVRDEAVAWIRAHPAEFVRLTASRAWHVWFGPPARPLEALPVMAVTVLALLGLRRALPRLAVPQRAAIIVPLVAYPLVYYLVGYVPRYLFPISGLLLVLAATEVTAWRPPAPRSQT